MILFVDEKFKPIRKAIDWRDDMTGRNCGGPGFVRLSDTLSVAQANTFMADIIERPIPIIKN